MPEPIGPTAESARIDGLDVARGFALLGIFFVNIFFMSHPLGLMGESDPVRPGPVSDAVRRLTWIFFESKSYPLFSMLFGMGLVLMYDRAKAAGRPFVARYMRRLLMLFLMGAAHILLLWYGDILAYYAMIGFVVMWFAPLRARTLLVLACACVLVATVVAIGFSLLMSVGETAGAQPEPAPLVAEAPVSGEAPAIASSFGEFMGQLRDGEVVDGPFDPLWAGFEARVHSQGPYPDAVAMRAFNWVMGAIFWLGVNGILFHITAMFLLGGALMRAGFFERSNRRLVVRLALVGAFIGVPAVILAEVFAPAPDAGPGIAGPITHALVLVCGPLVSLLYLSLATLAAQSFRANILVRAVAAAGRMALTNYLMQTFIVVVLMQHWGFGWYGQLDRVQLAGVVVAIYALQLVVSPIWLSRFSMGPLEWAWRAWTYLRIPKLLRREP